MTWAAIIPIIAQYGIPLAEKLVEKWLSGSAPTLADFAELRALMGQNAKDRMKAALTAAGIPLDDPKAVQLISLAT
jgi:hypothetical protein